MKWSIGHHRKPVSTHFYGSNLFIRLNYWIVACGGQPVVNPPELAGIENPSSATIVCQGDTFTFKLDLALNDNGGIFLVIEPPKVSPTV